MMGKMVFRVVLNTSAWVARKAYLAPFTKKLMRWLAHLSIRKAGIDQQTEPQALGDTWKKVFTPGDKNHPIKEIKDGIVYAEIHTDCPLRGTGDVKACYRLMEYDRTILSKAGGEFLVLESQAEPGRSYCKVAMHLKGTESQIAASRER